MPCKIYVKQNLRVKGKVYPEKITRAGGGFWWPAGLLFKKVSINSNACFLSATELKRKIEGWKKEKIPSRNLRH